ncbi:zona pellucida sperm-binding protein 3-like [Cheilinus undulatus]|uniref:zona pellucida sperm-binding protein 3-like n=1 Tax=Cheilinus undulatus TaxID=241271 RepID=UPI001BD3AB1B|nr:zona pellucida sperm-binding protein 3-like [Cheilinus undulatus]
MWASALSASLLLLMFVVSDAIRLLKEGPMIDEEGREYKSLRFDPEPEEDDEHTVRVVCTESTMIVMVKPDLYKNGHLLSAAELFLGEARCRAGAAADSEFIIEAGLQECGATLTITENSVIYSNKLIVSPVDRYQGITRTYSAVIPVSCHYKRTPFVSSNSHQSPLTLQSPTQRSGFSLTLMSDDWTQELFSGIFYLGDVVHLQASYSGPDAAHRRLLIDSCVATLSPDVTSVPRYYFVENHGCLTDAKDGGPNTRFRPRTRADSLQLQMDAFLFHGDSRNMIFLTCQLKVTADMWRSSRTNKACDYIYSRWKNVDGGDDVCRCCDSSCLNSSPVSDDIVACGSVTLGPLTIFPNK